MFRPVSPRLDLPLVVFVWLLGFIIVHATGSWTPLAVMAMALAARLIVGDATTRMLLRPRLVPVLVGLAAGAAMAGATVLLYQPLAHVIPGLAGETTRLYRILRADRYDTVSLAVITSLVGTCEEILWRGRVLETGTTSTERRIERTVVLSFVYGAAHCTSGSLTLMCVAALCGIVWGLLRIASGSLWTSILTHVLWDLTILVICPLV